MKNKLYTYGLTELGYKIFLDRYAEKDPNRKNIEEGDTVIVLMQDNQESLAQQREIGIVLSIDANNAMVYFPISQETKNVPKKFIDRPLELSPEQLWARVAKGAASVEKPAKQKEWNAKFQWLLDDWKFVPGGRIMNAIGSEQKLTAMNCYVLPHPHDSRGGIMSSLTDMAEIMSRGGGVGMNVSSLRPRHSYVAGVNGRSSGSVSWAALFSFVTGLIEQSGCFGPDVRIATDKGLIRAEDLIKRIENGEDFQAKTHDGFRKITDKFRNGVKELYEVTTSRGYKVQITEDHKVAVLMGGKIVTMALKYLNEGDEILLLLGDLSDGDYVELENSEYKGIRKKTIDSSIKFPKKLTEDLAYWLGYSYGDGYVHYREDSVAKAIKLSTADNHASIQYRLKALTKSLFDKEVTIEKGNGAWTNLAVYSTWMLEWLKENNICKQKSENIRVPEKIFLSPSSVQLAFVAGYFDADGSNRKRKGGYGFDSVSKEMLEDVQIILGNNGIVSRLHKQDRSDKGWRDLYRLNVTGNVFRQRFADLVPAEKTDKADNGKRDMYNTYPAEVLTSLGERRKYWNTTYDGKSTRVSVNQITEIHTKLLEADRIDSAKALQETMKTLPDTITSIESVSEAETFDFEVESKHLISGNLVYTLNSRRGALMVMLDDWHPDAFDFISSKQKTGRITNANISINLSDGFMKAVKNDRDWAFVFPNTSHNDYDAFWNGDIEDWVTRQAGNSFDILVTYGLAEPYDSDRDYEDIDIVPNGHHFPARLLWNKIIANAHASAEPGIWFKERTNKMSNSSYYDEGQIVATNPCAEQGLPPYGACNLGALNLSKFWDEANNSIDWALLEETIYIATRFLDNVLDASYYPLEMNKTQQQNERRVGLGIMGLAELLIKAKVRYGSKEGVVFTQELFAFIRDNAYLASISIAREKGAFHHYSSMFLEQPFVQNLPTYIQEEIADHGIRNVTLLTIAPTGSSGTMVNTSTGIEPYFSWNYYRKSRLGVHEENVPIVQDYIAKNDTQEWRGDGLPTLPRYFVTSMELSPEEHVAMLAAAQEYIDASISKTINAPNDYSLEDTEALYMLLYDMGCKGGTIYRDGSRDEQVLTVKESNHDDSTITLANAQVVSKKIAEDIENRRLESRKVESESREAYNLELENIGNTMHSIDSKDDKMSISEALKREDEIYKGLIDQKLKARKTDSDAEYDPELEDDESIYDLAASVDSGSVSMSNAIIDKNAMDILWGVRSADTALLSDNTIQEREDSVIHRPKRSSILNSKTLRGETPYGTVFISISEDPLGVPFEMFINVGKSGSDLQAQAESMGRLISVSLQAQPMVKRLNMLTLLMSQIRYIGGARPYGLGANRLASFPDAIAKVVQEKYLKRKTAMWQEEFNSGINMIEPNNETIEATIIEANKTYTATFNPVDEKDSIVEISSIHLGAIQNEHKGVSGYTKLPTANTCPDCQNTTLIREGGCSKCAMCGYSEC